MRAFIVMGCLVLILSGIAAEVEAQSLIPANGYSASSVATGIPGNRHQVGLDAAGFVYVAEEKAGGFTTAAIHRVGAIGQVVIDFIPAVGPGQPLVSAGQMVTDTDGSCLIINHWEGALEHNIVTRIEVNGTLTGLHDVLWGTGHGFTIDDAGDYFVGSTVGLVLPRQIYRIAAGQLGNQVEQNFADGPGLNAWLAPAGNGSLLCADGASLWLVRTGQPDIAIYTHLPPGGSSFEWRGLIPSPFGPGHIVSLVDTTLGPGPSMGLILAVDPTGTATQIASATTLGAGDLGIADDGNGGLLVMHEGELLRIASDLGSVSFPLGAIVTPPGAIIVQFDAPGFGGQTYVPVVSCSFGSTPIAGFPEPLHLATDPCTNFYFNDPLSPFLFALTGVPGALFGTLDASGRGVGVVAAPATIVPPGLGLDVLVTFLTLSGPTVTGSHGLGQFRFD